MIPRRLSPIRNFYAAAPGIANVKWVDSVYKQVDNHPLSTRYSFTIMATLLLVSSYIALTAADFATTLFALKAGTAVELNPAAAHGTDDIRIGFLVIANITLLLPLCVAFAVGIVQAHRVPDTALRHWWRHVADIFYVSPLNEQARQRRPLRLVTAAMTLLVLKLVIVGSNLLVIAGYPNPTTLLAVMWTQAGLEGTALYWAAYGVMIVPCYIAAVGLAAATLKLAQRYGVAEG